MSIRYFLNSRRGKPIGIKRVAVMRSQGTGHGCFSDPIIKRLWSVPYGLLIGAAFCYEFYSGIKSKNVLFFACLPSTFQIPAAYLGVHCCSLRRESVRAKLTYRESEECYNEKGTEGLNINPSVPFSPILYIAAKYSVIRSALLLDAAPCRQTILRRRQQPQLLIPQG